MDTNKKQTFTDNIARAEKKKQNFWKLEQLLKADEDLPECEKDGEQDIPSGLLTQQKQTQLSSAGSNHQPYGLSIQKDDISNLMLTELLKRIDLNKLTYFSFDLTNLIGSQSTFLLLFTLLSKLTNLESLDLILQQNELKDAHAEQLYLILQSMKQLRSLKFNMTKCNSSNKGITSIAQGISQLSCTLTILALNIQENPINDNGFESVSQMLDKCIKLQELAITIGGNKNNELGIYDLTKSISKLVLLEKLKFSLNNCYISLNSTTYIFKCIQPLVNLVNLIIFLDIDEIDKKQMVALTKKFINFEQLQTIKFEITGDAYYLIKSNNDDDNDNDNYDDEEEDDDDDDEVEEDGEQEEDEQDEDEEEHEEVEEVEEIEEGAEIDEADEGKYHGDWLKAIELSCKKNARRLVNYQMLIKEPSDY